MHKIYICLLCTFLFLTQKLVVNWFLLWLGGQCLWRVILGCFIFIISVFIFYFFLGKMNIINRPLFFYTIFMSTRDIWKSYFYSLLHNSWKYNFHTLLIDIKIEFEKKSNIKQSLYIHNFSPDISQNTVLVSTISCCEKNVGNSYVKEFKVTTDTMYSQCCYKRISYSQSWTKLRTLNTDTAI